MTSNSCVNTADAKTVRSNCRLCAASCGILVTLDCGRIVKVAGDTDHPVSRGFTCAKGRAIPDRHHAYNRLDYPRLGGARTSWEVVLDDAAGRMRRLIAEGGPDRVACYFGSGSTTDDSANWAIRQFFDRLGSNQFYSAASVDCAPLYRASELVTGFPHSFPSWSPDDPTPTLMVMVGVNPGVSMGHLGPAQSNWMHRLRRFRGRGGELWVMDPRRTKTAAQADYHIAPRPGSDVFVFAWLVRELLKIGFEPEELASSCDHADVKRLRHVVADFDLLLVADKTGLTGEQLQQLLEAIRRHKQVGILPGTGVSFGPYAVLTAWLIWAVMIITRSLDRPGGLRILPQPPGLLDVPRFSGHAPEDGTYVAGPASRPDLTAFFGQRPSVALADEIEAGEIRALLLWGGNPLTSLPDPSRTRAALKKLDLFAVIDVFENELTELATHVIPSTWLMEHSSIVYSPWYGDGHAYFSRRVLEPAAERRPAWWIFTQLAQRLNIDLFDDACDVDRSNEDSVIQHLVERRCAFASEVIAAGSHGVEIPFEYGWFHEKVLPNGRWRIAPRVLVERLREVWGYQAESVRLVAGRILTSVNSAHYAQSDDVPPKIHLSGVTAERYDIREGDRIRVSTDSGAVEGIACIDPKLAAGCIWMAHGWTEQNVNNLTDHVHVDRLTSQPILSAFAVALERLA